MAYRTFVDDNGCYWQVWDVRPQRVERRSLERRQSSTAWSGPERRQAERRQGERRSLHKTRVVISDGGTTGWLIFESLHQRLKLVGIPPGWEKYTQTQLRMLAKSAKPYNMPNGRNGVSSAAG